MKYIIEVEDESTNGLYRAKGFETLVFDDAGLKKLEPISDALQHGYEDGYQDGLNDAWECAGKILSMERTERENCFGTSDLGTNNGRGIITHRGCRDCLEKIKEYEEEQKKAESELKVGDEIEISGASVDVLKMVVTQIDNQYISTVDAKGDTRCICKDHNKFVKTGRHFSQIEEVLKQMKGE